MRFNFKAVPPSVVVMAVGSLVACAGNRPRLEPTPALANDRGMFAVVAERLKLSFGSALEMTPATFGADPSALDPIVLSGASAHHLAVERRSVLDSLHITIVPAATRGRCPRSYITRQEMSLCPSIPVARAAVGVARPGGAYLPSSMAAPSPRSDSGYFSIRVLLTRMDSTGAGFTALDDVLQRRGDKWVIVMIVPLFHAP